MDNRELEHSLATAQPELHFMCRVSNPTQCISAFPSRCSFESVIEASVAMLHAIGHAGGERVIARFL